VRVARPDPMVQYGQPREGKRKTQNNPHHARTRRERSRDMNKWWLFIVGPFVWPFL
jgi:hypothetical protein